jgi:prevent-host-death family protein
MFHISVTHWVSMTDPTSRSIGMRELRHRTTEVMARVKRGEILDVTDHGKLVARLIPIPEQRTPLLERLSDAGRLRRATRPGYRPQPRSSAGADLLSDALESLRDDAR